jgi:hypothetical protein
VALAAVGTVGALVVSPRWRVGVVAGGGAAALTVCAAVLASGPWGSGDYAGGDAAAQVLCLVALGLVLGSAVVESRDARSHRNA